MRPLFQEDDHRNRPEPIGTCVLFAVGSRRFLVTAAHVLDEVHKSPVYLGYGETMIPLDSGQIVGSVMPDSGRDNDPIDIGVLALQGDRYLQLKDEDFLGPDEVDVNEVAEPEKFYIAIGFPADQVVHADIEPQLKFDGITSMGRGKPELFDELRVFSPHSHILVEYEQECMVIGDDYKAAPDPHGMSGGALFRFDSVKAPGKDEKDPLVGILIEFRRKHRLMVATQISFVIDVIRTGFPDLDSLLPQSDTLRIKSKVISKL